MENKQVFLFLSNSLKKTEISTYKEIHKATSKMGDSCILYHLNNKELIPKEIESLNYYIFSDNILSELHYFPINNRLIPGNNHFPLMKFYLNNPQYDYYWCIEDDVKFNGEWSFLFDTFSMINADFVTSHIRYFDDEPLWHWWASLKHPSLSIPFNRLIRSFNPIYRISKNALKFIHESLLNRWQGHHEVLFPTLLKEAGFRIVDLGGSGQFVLSGFENKFYISSKPDIDGVLNDGTMRWRPIFTEIGDLQNKLYHPVKGTNR